MTYKEKEEFYSPKIVELLQSGMGIKPIIRELKVTRNLIVNVMKKNNILESPLKLKTLDKDFKFTKYQREVLIGCILGDGYLSERNNSVNCNILQSVKQKEYLLHKKEIFNNCSGKLYEYKKDKRHEFSFRLNTNQDLKQIYSMFYKDKIKYLNKEVLNELTGVSLAFWYMDDGWLNKKKYYYLATHCFSKDDIQLLKEVLKDKFDIDINLFKDGSISIKANSSHIFYNLIKEHIIPSLQYKIGSPH
jgi:hypothetical protein